MRKDSILNLGESNILTSLKDSILTSLTTTAGEGLFVLIDFGHLEGGGGHAT